MVLSRKKLKQKFRSLVTESIADNELKNSRRGISSSADVNQELESIRELLFTKSRKPKLHKRGKRQKNSTLPEDLKNGVATLEACEGNMDISENGGKEGFDDLKENGKGKKRKSGNNEGGDLDEGLQNTEKLEKQKDKKVKKKKKKKRREVKLKKKGKDGVEGQDNSNNGDAIKSVNAESKIQEVAVPVQVDESEKTKVYVGGIPYYSSEDDIISFFQDCGTVTEMDCMTFPETGKFRGIAILTFKTEGGAQRALALDGADMGGFYLKIQPYKASRNQKSDFAPEIIDGYHRVYVGNLSWDISEDDLKKLFSDCKISSVRFGTDKETGDFKGYAHVDFADSVSLTIALKLDQSVLCGRPVRIRCAVPRKSGQSESISVSGQKKQEVKQVVEDFSVNADDSACAEETPVVESVSASADASAGARKPKRKRQTCYVCGTPGHISSDCPQKTANAAS